MSEIFNYVKELCAGAKRACASLVSLSGAERDALLLAIADGLKESAAEIEAANALDCENAEKNGVKPTMIDRLRFRRDRIEAAADAVRYVAKLESPI